MTKVNFKGPSMVDQSEDICWTGSLCCFYHRIAKYKTIRQCLGISGLSKNQFYEVIELIYPYFKGILDGMYEEKG